MEIPIIDSHIHLWTSSHLDTLSWHSASNPVGSQYSVEEYLGAIPTTITALKPTSPSSPSAYTLKGFVYLETDRITSLSSEDWNHVLDEVSFLARIARGTPLDGEGHGPSDKTLCLAIIPWAPVPLGPEGLERYIVKVKERIGDRDDEDDRESVWRKIKGVRYLLQDKPRGTMLEENFVQGLKWLGQQDLVFDLGVDARRGGIHQLEETVELTKTLNRDGCEVKLILNHLCKPNLRIPLTETFSHPQFIEWKKLITSFSAYPNTYMKLSGLFSEIPPLPTGVNSEQDEAELVSSTVNAVHPWTDVIFDTFGTTRVMFGSDWPISNIGGGGKEVAWTRWMKVVELLLEKRGIGEDGKRDAWYRTAQTAYSITL
ncbi:hypothetical protein FQN49_003174 [Arthroderma sp. PD_2]|nr:hypothetical protein FQN49_003174 [Arthroderma sp. PD_2]